MIQTCTKCDTFRHLRIYSLWEVRCLVLDVKVHNGYHAQSLASRCGKYEPKEKTP